MKVVGDTCVCDDDATTIWVENNKSCEPKPACTAHGSGHYLIKDDACICPSTGAAGEKSEEKVVKAGSADVGCFVPCGANEERTTDSHLCECKNTFEENSTGDCVKACSEIDTNSERNPSKVSCICKTDFELIDNKGSCVQSCAFSDPNSERVGEFCECSAGYEYNNKEVCETSCETIDPNSERVNFIC